MSRRGRTGAAAISLFSFQDIITSVTAIMILLVLILTLELVTRSQQSGVAAEDRRVARQLREAVEALEQRAAELRREAERLEHSASRAAGFSAAATEQRREEAETAASRLRLENQSLEPRLRAASSERRAAEAALVRAAGSADRMSEDRVEELEAAVTALEAANRREQERQAASRPTAEATPTPRLVYNPDPENAKRPVLLEVAKGRLTALEGGDRLITPLGSGTGRAFRRWVDGLDRSSQYVVLILRPSGIELVDDVREAIVRRRVEVGLELVGEDMRVEVAATAGGT